MEWTDGECRNLAGVGSSSSLTTAGADLVGRSTDRLGEASSFSWCHQGGRSAPGGNRGHLPSFDSGVASLSMRSISRGFVEAVAGGPCRDI